MRRVLWTAGLLAVTVLAPVGAAMAQSADTRALLDRLDRLERDIRTLNVQIARGGGGAVTGATAEGGAGGDPAYARMSVRLSQVENDLRAATGRVEEMSFQLNQIAQQIEKLSTDINFRLNQIEKGGMTSQAGIAPSSQLNAPGLVPAQPGAVPGAVPGALPAAPAPQATAPGAINELPPGSQVLGTLSQSDLAAAQAPAAAPAETEQLSEADALLAQLTGDDTDVAAAAPVSEPAPAPAPAAAPAPTSVNVASAPSTAAAAINQTAALPDGTPREKYMHAFGLLRQGQYDIAASALKNFIDQHSDDPLSTNARYWLGETYYVRGAFVEAAETFLEGYQADTKGPKAPDALLKLGMSLASLNKKQEACAAFQKLRADYPDAPQGLKSTLQREWQRNGCV